MKKKLLISLLITAVLAVGITLAFMFRQTEPIENKFTDAKVACSVVEEFNDVQKTSIQVKNEGNIDCYLRVRLVSYWQNADGEIVGKPSVIPAIDVNDGWMAGESKDVFYYTSPVAAGKTTESNLLQSPLELAQEDDNGETFYQVVKVFAEAVQAEPEDAVKAAWPFFAAGHSE